MKQELALERIKEVAVDLAARLTHLFKVDWVFDPKYDDHRWGTQITDNLGHALFIHRSYRDCSRLSISGGQYPDEPRNYYGTPSAPSITVGGDRPLDKIWSETQRRFLPDYLKLWNEVKAKFDGQNRAKDKCQQVTEELAALAGENGKLCNVNDRQAEPSINLGSVSTQGWYGTVRVSWNSEDAKVEFNSLPIDIVKRILAVLPQKKEKGS